jgi:hypothetical protein
VVYGVLDGQRAKVPGCYNGDEPDNDLPDLDLGRPDVTDSFPAQDEVKALYTELRAIRDRIDALEAADPDPDRASLLIGLRRSIDAVRLILDAAYGSDTGRLVEKAEQLLAAAQDVAKDASVVRDRPRLI